MSIVAPVARRYLFSHKGTYFINIISGVTIFGLSMGTAALILVLSVFNGFEDLIASMINSFNPDLKIVPSKGKYFYADSIELGKILQTPGVDEVSKTISEIAFFEYDQANNPGTMKGVDGNFRKVTQIDSTLIEGRFLLEDQNGTYAVLGAGMARNLSVDVLNAFNKLSVHMLDRSAAGNAQRPYKTRLVRPIGVFSIQQEIDNEFILVPLGVGQSLLNRPGEVSALEISIDSSAKSTQVESALQDLLGPDFQVLTLYEQDEEFLKLMNIEKWMAYAIATLMILLIAFNLIGCLWMIVLDKKKDIAILRAMGATSSMIRGIFLRLGLYFTATGLIIGTLIALGMYFMQKEFGLITMSQGFVVDSYPITMKGSDLIVVALTVLSIGLLASLPASRSAAKMGRSIREN